MLNACTYYGTVEKRAQKALSDNDDTLMHQTGKANLEDLGMDQRT